MLLHRMDDLPVIFQWHGGIVVLHQLPLTCQRVCGRAECVYCQFAVLESAFNMRAVRCASTPNLTPENSQTGSRAAVAPLASLCSLSAQQTLAWHLCHDRQGVVRSLTVVLGSFICAACSGVVRWTFRCLHAVWLEHHLPGSFIPTSALNFKVGFFGQKSEEKKVPQVGFFLPVGRKRMAPQVGFLSEITRKEGYPQVGFFLPVGRKRRAPQVGFLSEITRKEGYPR